MSEKTVIKTLRVRVRDKHIPLLRRMAYEVNQVWNLANETSYEAWHVPVPEVGWVQGYWLIGSSTVQEVIAVHAKSRRQYKMSKLRWRSSGGKRRALGWVPFKSRAAQWQNGQVKFAGHYFQVWDSYGLSKYRFRAGSFDEDARGRWYFNIAVAVEVKPSTGAEAIGIDLGLKETSVCSDGDKLEALRPYRDLEQKLGIAQRAGKKTRVRAIHAMIANRRRDTNHKFSTALVNRTGAIFVGNVSSSNLVKDKKTAKSVLDAGWHQLKTQLEYKAIARSVWFEEINEAYTTQTCCACGTTHDRDVNAARNILALGHQRLAGGIPVL